MGNPWCRKHETEKVRYPSGGLYCKACKSERNRAYRAAHGDRLRAHDQAMYRADRDAVRTRHAAYRTENRGACQARVRAWKVAHPEKVLADRRAWISAKKDLRRAYAACRRAVKRGAVCEHGPSCVSAQMLTDLQTSRCFYCGAAAEHADHFVPLSRGGRHCAQNLVAACARCNLSKGNKIVDEWRQRAR
jgi:5-methylcytosine-specific restriction endonuclease McrA